MAPECSRTPRTEHWLRRATAGASALVLIPEHNTVICWMEGMHRYRPHHYSDYGCVAVNKLLKLYIEALEEVQ